MARTKKPEMVAADSEIVLASRRALLRAQLLGDVRQTFGSIVATSHCRAFGHAGRQDDEAARRVVNSELYQLACVAERDALMLALASDDPEVRALVLKRSLQVYSRDNMSLSNLLSAHGNHLHGHHGEAEQGLRRELQSAYAEAGGEVGGADQHPYKAWESSVKDLGASPELSAVGIIHAARAMLAVVTDAIRDHQLLEPQLPPAVEQALAVTEVMLGRWERSATQTALRRGHLRASTLDQVTQVAKKWYDRVDEKSEDNPVRQEVHRRIDDAVRSW